MIDLHSHILPGLDDGPPDLAGSVALAHAASEAGTTVMVATPHVRADHPYDLGRIGPEAARLNVALRDASIPLEVATGGEVAITELAEPESGRLDGMCIGDGPFMLVESPYTHTGSLLERVLFEAQLAGLRPLLAHPERSPCFVEDVDRLEEIVSRGILCSVTAGSMAGYFGTTVRDFTLTLFERGLVHDVASDTHSVERRPPGLRRGFEAAEEHMPGLLAQIDWYTLEAPGAILAGQSPPPAPEPPRRRTPQGARVWSRLRAAPRRR